MFKKSLTIIATSVFFWTFATATQAALTYEDANSSLGVVAQKTGMEKISDLPLTAGTIVKAILSILGLLFFILVVYAGFKWMLAKGEEEQVTKARDTIFGAVIGLSIVMASYAVTNFINERFISNQGGFDPLKTGGTIGNEQLGCCIKWSTGGDWEESGTASSLITTEQDCKNQGEQQGSSNEADGGVCTGPKEGCWLFSPNLTQCQEQADAYN